MFLNLSPYLTWISIMLTSKPADLQNQINKLTRPVTIQPTTSTLTPEATTIPNTTVNTSSTLPPGYFICSGKPIGRYPHKRDCNKFYACNGDVDIVKPTLCPHSLHFSPTALLCTLADDAECASKPTTGSPTESVTTSGTVTTGITYKPGTWLNPFSNFYKAVDEDRLVMFYDRRIQNPQSLLWPISFTRDMWDSIIMMYGSFGDNNRLYIVLRISPSPSQELNYASYLDSTKGNKNAIEVCSADWFIENSTNTDLIARNLAQIVSRNARGIRYPGTEPGWADIFVYDFYSRIGKTAERDEWESNIKQEDANNIATIPLFSQWYLPIYQRYGGGAVLNRFLIAREQNLLKAENDNTTFSRTLNRGEFIHFWSGAAGVNLKDLATTVFNWSTELNEQFEKARTDFRNLVYV